MEELRIHKQRLALGLRLTGGDLIEGYVFLQQSRYGRSRETLLELLNQPEPFFPVDCDGIGILLVAKTRMVETWGEAIEEDDELRIAASQRVSVELRMASGVRIVGTMLLEVPSTRPRLLDFLNGDRQRFHRISTDSGPRIINANLIESVRPLD